MKFAELPTKSGDRTLSVENAVVKSVSITNMDHGCLTAWLHLDIGESMGYGFGGYKLGNADSTNLHVGDIDYCAEFLMR